MKQHARLLFAVLNGGIQSFGFINAFFFLIWKRESQEVRVQEHSISVQNWWFPWISPDDSFLTQVLETSDHFKSNTGKAQLFYTGKESTWHGYIEFRDLHHPPMFLDRSGGAGRKIIANSRGAAYSKTPQSKALTPCWLLLFSLAMCCCPGTAVGSSERTRLSAHKGSATQRLWPNVNGAAIYCVPAMGLPLLCLGSCLIFSLKGFLAQGRIMKSNFLFYCSSLCLLLTCLLREAIFVTAGEKRVGSCVSRLIRVSNGCFLGDEKKKNQVSSQGIFLCWWWQFLFCGSSNLDERGKNTRGQISGSVE